MKKWLGLIVCTLCWLACVPTVKDPPSIKAQAEGDAGLMLEALLFPDEIATTPAAQWVEKMDSILLAERDEKTTQQLQQALQYFMESRELEDTLLIHALNLQRKTYYWQRDWDNALRVCQEVICLEQRQAPIRWGALGKAYYHLGKIHNDAREFPQALSSFRKVIYALEQLHDPRWEEFSPVYNSMGRAFRSLAESDSAITYYLKSLAIETQISDTFSVRVAILNFNIGQLYTDNRSYKKAFTYLRKTLSMGRAHPELSTVFLPSLHLTLGNSYFKQSQVDSARYYWEQGYALLAAQARKESSLAGILLCNLARSYHDMGAIEKSLQYYEKSIDVFVHLLAKVPGDIGYSYYMGDLHSNLAAFYQSKGMSERALFAAQKALSLYEGVQASASSLANVQVNLGIAYEGLGQLEKAEESFQKSLLFSEEAYGHDHREVANAYFNLGLLAIKQEAYEEALEHVRMTLEIRQKLWEQGDADLLLETYGQLGRILRLQGRWESAIEKLKEGLSQRELHQQNPLPQIGTLYLELGKAHHANQAYRLASQALDQGLAALQWDERQPHAFTTISDPDRLMQLFGAKINLLEEQGSFRGDIAYLDTLGLYHMIRVSLQDFILRERGSLFLESDAYLSTLTIYEDAISYLSQRGRPEDLAQAFLISEKSKSRQLIAKLAFDADHNAFGLPDSIREQEYALRVTLSYAQKQAFEQQYYTPPGAERDSLLALYQSRAFSLRQQEEAFHARLKLNYPDYHRLRYEQSVIKLFEVQKKLLGKKHDALVSYFIGEDHIYTWVVLADTFYLQTRKRDFPLEKWIESLRCNLLREQELEKVCAKDSSYPVLAFQLYQKLFASVDSLLPAQASVLIVPDEVLGYLPFETLLTEPSTGDEGYASHSYLLRDHTISYAYSATLQQEMISKVHTQPPSHTLLAVAPTFAGDTNEYKALSENQLIDSLDRRSLLSALAYNVPEAEAVVGGMGGDLLTGEEATEEAFVNRAGDYRILHLSTHGKANDQAGDYSFLAFQYQRDDSIEIENEWLYNSEIYTLQLNADLVVLSACETGIGELKRGEGIISLARGFSYAGAKSLVTSLWNVNDRSSKVLMELFYRNLTLGMPKHEALRQAKLDYLDTHPDYLQSPFYWAAFIPIGDMEALEIGRSRPIWQGIGWLLAIILVIGSFIWFIQKRVRQTFS